MSSKENELSFRQMLGLLSPKPAVIKEEEKLVVNEPRELSFEQMLWPPPPSETKRTK